MSHYTQPAGTSAGNKYFQDVEISPATVKDGTLVQRFDTVKYPAKGVQTAKRNSTVVLTASSVTPAADASVTLTATCASVGPGSDKPSGTVTFKDGVTTLGTGTPNASGVATLVVAGGFAAGAHSLTAVVAADANVNTSTSSVLTVTAS